MSQRSIALSLAALVTIAGFTFGTPARAQDAPAARDTRPPIQPSIHSPTH
ncbi:MAG: hypothetical protein ABL916_18295 [Burkholderiaceae bacterium]